MSKDINNLNDLDTSIIKMSDEIKERILKGDSLCSVQGITPSQLEALYSIGYSMYNSKQYTKATDIFKFLVVQQHLEVRYWHALGAALKMNKHYQDALSCFSVAALMKFDELRGLDMAECAIFLKDVGSACNILTTTIKFAQKSGKKDIQRKAEKILESIGNSADQKKS